MDWPILGMSYKRDNRLRGLFMFGFFHFPHVLKAQPHRATRQHFIAFYFRGRDVYPILLDIGGFSTGGISPDSMKQYVLKVPGTWSAQNHPQPAFTGLESSHQQHESPREPAQG